MFVTWLKSWVGAAEAYAEVEIPLTVEEVCGASAAVVIVLKMVVVAVTGLVLSVGIAMGVYPTGAKPVGCERGILEDEGLWRSYSMPQSKSSEGEVQAGWLAENFVAVDVTSSRGEWVGGF